MTEVHIRHYVERRATLTTYDWHRRHYVQREHVRYVPSTQVVEWDDTEPVTPWETRNMRAERLRAENTERIRALLREQGPHTRQAIQRQLGLKRMMVEKLLAGEIERGNMQRVGWYHRFRVFGLVGQTFEPPHEYERHGLTIYEALRQHGDMTVSQIVAATGLTHSNAHRLLKRYEGDLFERVQDTGYRVIWAVIEQEDA